MDSFIQKLPKKECPICGSQHSIEDCHHPQIVRRCQNCNEMVFTADHQCNGPSDNSHGYRVNVLASKANPQFKLRIATSMADMYYFDVKNKKFEDFHSASYLLCPATSGVITVGPDSEGCNVLSYHSSKSVKFTFYIALLAFDGPEITLRVVIAPPYGIFFVKCGIKMHKTNGKITWENAEGIHTALVLGLIERSNEIIVQVKYNNESSKSLRWRKQSGWIIPDMNGIPNIPVDQPISEKCQNCNGRHSVLNCQYPTYSIHCSGCLVVSFDGDMHENPCQPKNKISQTRSDLFATHALTLFQMLYSTEDGQLLYLSKDGTFCEMSERTKLISGPAEGLFIQQQLPDSKQCIAFKQTTFKRCSVLLAVLDRKNVWRLRFRIVITNKSGLLVFPLTTSLPIKDRRIQIPPGFENNLVALFGIRMQSNIYSFYMELKVHANANGKLSTSCFDGYTGHIGIDIANDIHQKHIDDALNGVQPQPDRRFNRKLYGVEPKPISSFKTQQEYITGYAQCKYKIFFFIIHLIFFHRPNPTDDEDDDSDWSSEDGAVGGNA